MGLVASLALAACCGHLLPRAACAEAGPLEPLAARASARVPAASAGAPAPCAGVASGGLNVFATRARHGAALTSLEVAALDAVLFSHPGAAVFLLDLGALDEALFDDYLREGYCVVPVHLELPWAMAALRHVDPGLPPQQVDAMASDRRALPVLINCVILALQIAYGGISLVLDGLLLNPLDTPLPAALPLGRTAVFIERVLGPEEAAPPEVLGREDFELSWMPRSHTDRADERTMVCGDHLCPRAIPRGCPLGRALLAALLEAYRLQGAPPRADAHATRLYSAYVRARPRGADGLPTRPRAGALLGEGEFAAVALPGWVIVEPHFPDGWRHYGHRGLAEEADDRASFHSQLYSPRAHRERSDWALVRALKLWLPLNYGPPSARNALPRSVVDLARRLLSLRLAPPGAPGAAAPLRFGRAPGGAEAGRPPEEAAAAGEAAGAAADAASSAHGWHTPLNAFQALDNSMAEALGVGERPATPREVALPGDAGGFRTFRDLRVVGRGRCRGPGAAPAPAASAVRAVVRLSEPRARLACRPSARPEAPPGAAPDSPAAWAACRAALAAGGAGGAGAFDLVGPPAAVNAALALLAYRPVPGLGHPPAGAAAGARLDAAALDRHFADLALELSEACPHGASGGPPPAPAPPGGAGGGGGGAGGGAGPPAARAPVRSVVLRALLDDVQDQVTVVAHSASRCDLLERLAMSFRAVYDRLPVTVTCECAEDQECNQPSAREHGSIPFFSIVDVPYDFGLSRGKRLLVQWVQTEFVLVLDDDFVRAPYSCLECMVLHMRSRLHALPLPFDMLGFPILEDERNFGAFRGTLRATSGRLFLEPAASEAAVDGCMRVGIHPMAFLARTARFRGFKFQDQLRVGEHEQFFYANRYLGLQAAVCFDSTFPHFRAPMAAGYKQRRERMQELMTKEFQKIGFPSMMYLLHKYDAYNGIDHNEFIQQDVPPWSISDDTCGPQPDPPADFTMFFAAVFSSPDALGVQFRQLLRGAAPMAWLPRLAAIAQTRWAFFLEEEAATPPDLAREEAEFGDLVFMPAARSPAALPGKPRGVPASQLRFAVAFLRDFHFRWLLVAEQAAFVLLEPALSALVAVEPPVRAAVGGWRGVGAGPGRNLLPQFFALSHDVKHLLASPRVVRWLRTADEPGGLDGGAALNAWLSPLDLRRVALRGVHTDWPGVAAGCPEEPFAVLHPVSPRELFLMSESAARAGSPCAGLNASDLAG